MKILDMGLARIGGPASQDDKDRLTASGEVMGRDTTRHPVEMVTWEDANAFCVRLSALPEEKRAQRSYRLPSEAQWECACRAGSPTRWCFGDHPAELGEYAWFRENAQGMTHPVGQKKPNAWGLCDIHGNVREWCADWYDAAYYASSPAVDPPGPVAGSNRVLRGSGWVGTAQQCAAARRHTCLTPSALYDGFRVVCEIPVFHAELGAGADVVPVENLLPGLEPRPVGR